MKQTGKFSDLKGMIDYQEGAIVSRELLKTNSGTVTLFAFDEGQGLSEHSAPYEALVFLLDGEAEIAIEKEPHHLGEGELILMPASRPHAVKAIRKFKMLLVLMTP